MGRPKGTPCSPETKAKLSAAIHAAWADPTKMGQRKIPEVLQPYAKALREAGKMKGPELRRALAVQAKKMGIKFWAGEP